MPDWLTHVLFAWALWNFLSLRLNLRYRGVFIAGSLLPDVKTVDMISPVDFDPFLVIFHTPLGAIITSGLLSMSLFRGTDKQARIFQALGISSLFHFLLDLQVSSMEGRVMLFFPLSFDSYSFNIFVQEDLTFLYFAILALLLSFLGKRIRNSNKL